MRHLTKSFARNYAAAFRALGFPEEHATSSQRRPAAKAHQNITSLLLVGGVLISACIGATGFYLIEAFKERLTEEAYLNVESKTKLLHSRIQDALQSDERETAVRAELIHSIVAGRGEKIWNSQDTPQMTAILLDAIEDRSGATMHLFRIENDRVTGIVSRRSPSIPAVSRLNDLMALAETASVSTLPGLIYGNGSSGPVLAFFEPIRLSTGLLIGLLGREVPIDELQRWALAAVLSGDQAVNIFGRDGTLLARAPNIHGVVGRNFSDSMTFRTIKTATAARFHAPQSQIDRKERLVYVQTFDRYPLVISSSVNVEDVLACTSPSRREHRGTESGKVVLR